MTWLVTGGAGYIGSHVVRALIEADLPVVVLDDLSTGFEEFVPPGVPFEHGSVLDAKLVDHTLQEHQVQGVIHIAGFKYAGVSVERPLHTYEQNVSGMVTLLKCMQALEIDKIVFSSSAATYGTPDVPVVTEATPTMPESPYGETKLIGEWMLRAAGTAYGLKHTSLRYFNVVGSGSTDLFDASPHNLFPRVFEMLKQGQNPQINGADYPTPDGTCVRDYVHVVDLAHAHVAAAQRPRAVPERIRIVQDLSRAGHQVLAGPGQTQAAAAALEQGDAELRPKIADLARKRGLGEAQPFGGARHGSGLDHRDEVAQMAQFHRSNITDKHCNSQLLCIGRKGRHGSSL